MVKVTQEGMHVVRHEVVFPQAETLIGALLGAAGSYAALLAAIKQLDRRFDEIMTQEEDTQVIVQQLRDITQGLSDQDTRLETAVAGLHAQIDALTGSQVTPATAQALKDAVSALAQTAGGFGQIEPAPAPAQPTDITPVVNPTPDPNATP